MIVIAFVALLVAVLGLLIFVLAKNNPDVKEIGRCLMWCGVLVTLLVLGKHTITIGGGG